MEPIRFKTYKAAEEKYLETHEYDNDDTRRELNVLDWVHGEGHHISEDINL